MDYIFFIASLFISAGALIMAFNVKKFQETIIVLKNISQQEYERSKHVLLIHKFLIISFLFGYVIVLYAVNSTSFNLGNLFVSFIFLSGAVFVLLGIILQKRMIKSIGSLYTKSLLSNEKLIKNKNHVSNILNSLPSIIVGLDSQGYCTMWNHMAEKFTSISNSDARNKYFAALIPALSSFENQIFNVINGHNKNFDAKLTLHMGENPRVFILSITPLIHEKTYGVVIRLDEITEKILLEKKITESEKMISLGGLAAGMAHEINNPLAGMIQNAQVIYSRLTQDLPANHNVADALGLSIPKLNTYMEKRGILKQLDNINSAGKRAAKIIHNMLDFAKNEPSNSKRHEHKARDLIESTLELAQNDFDLKKKYDFKQINIIREYCSGDDTILCDGTKIQQVLFNVIKNASQSMQDKRVDHEKPHLVLRIKKIPGKIQIEIEDNGPGIDQSTQKRIFEPFFTTKGSNSGTGLGLSVSYFIIVDDHGGEMSVESETGSGANFIITLPAT